MYRAPSGPNFASIHDCTLLSATPDGMIFASVSANAGGACCGTLPGSTVTATRLLPLDSSPMIHLSFQYAGHATPLLVFARSRWYVGPDMIAWPPPRKYGSVYVASAALYVGMFASGPVPPRAGKTGPPPSGEYHIMLSRMGGRFVRPVL